MKSEARRQIEAVNQVCDKTVGVYESWAKTKGLHYNSLMVLYILDEGGPCTQKQLCEALSMPKQTVNTILKGFEGRGLIRIEGRGGAGRQKPVAFTPEGQAYSRRVLQGLHRAEERALKRMGPELCAQLLKVNQVFYETLKQEVENE